MKKILLIDDWIEVQEVIYDWLSDTFQTEVFTTCNLSATIAILEIEKFDLIICDFELPDGDGKNVVDFMRAKSIGTPIIIFSGKIYIDLPLEFPLIDIITGKSLDRLINAVSNVGLTKFQR